MASHAISLTLRARGRNPPMPGELHAAGAQGRAPGERCPGGGGGGGDPRSSVPGGAGEGNEGGDAAAQGAGSKGSGDTPIVLCKHHAFLKRQRTPHDLRGVVWCRHTEGVSRTPRDVTVLLYTCTSHRPRFGGQFVLESAVPTPAPQNANWSLHVNVKQDSVSWNFRHEMFRRCRKIMKAIRTKIRPSVPPHILRISLVLLSPAVRASFKGN